MSHHIEEEGVHFRRSSADGIIRHSKISDTGLIKPGFGEGVYIGSAKSNFGCLGNSGGMDRSDRVQVLDNEFGPNIAAEHVDIKEGTEDGVIRGNVFDGQGISGENSGDSWIDAKGNDYLIESNTGTFTLPGTFANGYETHTQIDGYGCGNVFRDNASDLGGVGGVRHLRIVDVQVCLEPQHRVRLQHRHRRRQRPYQHRCHPVTAIPSGRWQGHRLGLLDACLAVHTQ